MDDSIKGLMENIKAIRYEFRAVSELIGYKRNPRKHNHLIEKFAEQIKEFGMPVPICITPDGTIVDGHLRYKAAKFLKLPEVPVAINNTWTPQQITAFRISVNQTATWAKFDVDLLRAEMELLDEDNYDLLFTGFEPKELNAIFAQPIEETADVVKEKEKEDGRLKIVQLTYEEEIEGDFMLTAKKLKRIFKTNDLSDTVYAALRQCLVSITEKNK